MKGLKMFLIGMGLLAVVIVAVMVYLGIKSASV
jgi:hypothetical protein